MTEQLLVGLTSDRCTALTHRWLGCGGTIPSEQYAPHAKRRIPLWGQAGMSGGDKEGSPVTDRPMAEERRRPTDLLAERIGRNGKVDDRPAVCRNQLCGREAWREFLLFSRL